MLGRIARISSVSGASLAIGLIYSHNSLRWPTDNEYTNTALPKIRDVLVKHNIPKIAVFRLLYSPYLWNKKVNLLSKVISDHWGITGSIMNIGETPKWFINCTTYETGKRFRFSQCDMGDYTIGYIRNPQVSLSDAISASAGFPIFIGPYCLKTNQNWEKSQYVNEGEHNYNGTYLHLWDGGVYDNLGIESVFKPDNGGQLCEGVDFIVVSNASASIMNENRTTGFSHKKLKRLLEISRDQNQALRSRMLIEYIRRTQKGVYLKIGRSAQFITSKSGANGELSKYLTGKCISDDEAEKVRDYKTTLNRPSEEDFDLILRHGYEVAMCTYMCYQ